MKHTVKLSLKQMYACKHALEKTLKSKKEVLKMILPGKHAGVYNEAQLNTLQQMEKDIQSEGHLLNKFIEEINVYKKMNNIP